MWADVFNNATSALAPFALKMNDELFPLIWTTQPIWVTWLAQSNKLTWAMSKTSANSALVSMKKQMRHNWNIWGYKAVKLLVPDELEYKANELFKSPQEPEWVAGKTPMNINYLNSKKLNIIS
jgi:hypothetical protein